MVPANSTVYQPEMACACEWVVYSSGGFSNYFAMPDYQKAAVDYPLINYYPNNMWNSTGMVYFFFSLQVEKANE